MTWRIIVVNQHSKLSYQNHALVFRHDSGLEKIHLSEIHTIICETTDISVTSALIAKCVAYKIKLIFCDEKRLPAGELTPYYGSHDTSKSIDLQIHWDPSIQKEVWTDLIAQKIANQSYHLLSRGKHEAHDQLQDYLTQLTLFDETNREGHAAKVYFNALFGKGFTRDQETDINAGLDYGYTLLLSVFSREIVKNGCMTQIGLKHSNVYNQFNLSSDLMEAFRPLVDQIVFENQAAEFPKIKRQLFELFARTYYFENKDMYLVNIVEIYVKKVIRSLNEGKKTVPKFIYFWEGR